MADTGNPWFIPFAEPSDLVRDWPALSSAVGTAVAAGLTNASNAGIGSNVVHAVKTNTFSTTSSGFQSVTGLSATITPSSATAKVLVIAQVNVSFDGTASFTASVRISGGNATDYRGGAASDRTRTAGAFYTQAGGSVAAHLANQLFPSNVVLLDSPATDSAVTYSVEVFRQAGTLYVNRSSQDLDLAIVGRGASSLTLIEVAV